MIRRTMIIISPDYSTPDHFCRDIQSRGYAALDTQGTSQLTGISPADLHAMKHWWDDLPADNYLRDGGRYRRRRHSSFVVDGDQVMLVPHRAHWQPVAYNALHGGLHRLFDPVRQELVESQSWQQLLRQLGHVCSTLGGQQPWFVETHQFRIDTTDGIGRPTPEGAHRDGVDYVAILLVERDHVIGGESRIFEANSRTGERFTLEQEWSLLMLDDGRMIHESTPIQPTAPDGHRDTLVITWRAGGFQDAPVAPA